MYYLLALMCSHPDPALRCVVSAFWSKASSVSSMRPTPKQGVLPNIYEEFLMRIKRRPGSHWPVATERRMDGWIHTSARTHGSAAVHGSYGGLRNPIQPVSHTILWLHLIVRKSVNRIFDNTPVHQSCRETGSTAGVSKWGRSMGRNISLFYFLCKSPLMI